MMVLLGVGKQNNQPMSPVKMVLMQQSREMANDDTMITTIKNQISPAKKGPRKKLVSLTF